MSYHPKAIRDHWTRVAALGCLISQGPAEICHTHGHSIVARDPRFLKPKGKKMLWQDWLVIPLAPRFHWMFDNHPREFEATYGTPAVHLDLLCERLGYDVWQRARDCMKPCAVSA